LASVQNADGSWGANAERTYLTAFGVLAFLQNGITPSTNEFGSNVENGLSWLSKQRPSSDLDKASALHVLTAAYRMTRDPALAKYARLRWSRVNIDDLGGASRILVQITARPDSAIGSLVGTDDALRSFKPHPGDPPQLSDYLAAIAVFLESRDSWLEYYGQSIRPLLAKQMSGGAFPSAEGKPCVETTIFTLLKLSIYYRYWTDYLDVGFPPPKTPAAEAPADSKGP
jgi:hypothetical protein